MGFFSRKKLGGPGKYPLFPSPPLSLSGPATTHPPHDMQKSPQLRTKPEASSYWPLEWPTPGPRTMHCVPTLVQKGFNFAL